MWIYKHLHNKYFLFTCINNSSIKRNKMKSYSRPKPPLCQLEPFIISSMKLGLQLITLSCAPINIDKQKKKGLQILRSDQWLKETRSSALMDHHQSFSTTLGVVLMPGKIQSKVFNPDCLPCSPAMKHRGGSVMIWTTIFTNSSGSSSY